jgi:MoaA/NifB/PqqE/SkfB family radical SAM enzyme
MVGTKQNIIKLKKFGINVTARSVFHRYNIDCVDLIKKFVREYDIPINIFTSIMSDCDLKTKHNESKLDIETSLEIYKKFAKVGDMIDRLSKGVENKMYCGAGLNSIFINPYGDIYLCPALINIANQNDFDECYEKLYSERLKYVEKPTPCTNCKNDNFCKVCYASYKKEYNCNFSALKNNVCKNSNSIINKLAKQWDLK